MVRPLGLSPWKKVRPPGVGSGWNGYARYELSILSVKPMSLKAAPVFQHIWLLSLTLPVMGVMGLKPWDLYPAVEFASLDAGWSRSYSYSRKTHSGHLLAAYMLEVLANSCKCLLLHSSPKRRGFEASKAFHISLNGVIPILEHNMKLDRPQYENHLSIETSGCVQSSTSG